jgi:hypothetical protein
VILSEVRDYLRQRGQATLADIALHFDSDPDALRGVLQVWVRKGKVQRQMVTASCGGSCTQCDPASTELYLWKETPISERPLVPVDCSHN